MSDVNDRFGYIYKITNKINGKIYVGKRVGSKLDESYWGSGSKISHAIKEFKIENFSREILEWCSTADVLKLRERYWIETLNARNSEVGYNIKPGGESHPKRKDGQPSASEGKRIIGFQVDEELNNALVDLAAEYGLNVSGVVRMVALDYLKRYKGFKPGVSKGEN